jgi:hypothetical protein
MNPKTTSHSQKMRVSENPVVKKPLQAIEPTDRGIHQIRRTILKKLEVRLSMENWSNSWAATPQARFGAVLNK